MTTSTCMRRWESVADLSKGAFYFQPVTPQFRVGQTGRTGFDRGQPSDAPRPRSSLNCDVVDAFSPGPAWTGDRRRRYARRDRTASLTIDLPLERSEGPLAAPTSSPNHPILGLAGEGSPSSASTIGLQPRGNPSRRQRKGPALSGLDIDGSGPARSRMLRFVPMNVNAQVRGYSAQPEGVVPG